MIAGTGSLSMLSSCHRSSKVTRTAQFLHVVGKGESPAWNDKTKDKETARDWLIFIITGN
jgi:hypothetical protein